MVILHAFMALLAGFATAILLSSVVTTTFARVPGWPSQNKLPTENTPTQKLQTSYMFVSLGASFLAAAAGGYVTAWMAVNAPLVHVLALGIIILALAALSVMQAKVKQGIWYQLMLVAIPPLGVLAGGLLRLRVLGIL